MHQLSLARFAPGIALALLASEASAQLFGPEQLFTDPIHDLTAARAVDIDGDGLVELVTADLGGRLLALPASGTATQGTFQVLRELDKGITHMIASDLDADGDMDLVYLEWGTLAVRWLENSGQGQFATRPPIGSGSSIPRQLLTGDLNGDGAEDVILAGMGGLLWFPADGAGGFGPSMLVPGSNTAVLLSAAVLDANGDGVADIAASYREPGAVRVWLGQGGGAFSLPAVSPNVAFAAKVVQILALDWDSDGDVDLVDFDSTSDFAGWHENQGGGLFAPRTELVYATFNIEKMIHADLDADGDQDLILGQDSPLGLVGWIENVGAGQAASFQVLSEATGRSSSLEAVDLDQDGKLDVLVGDGQWDRVLWLRGLGAGQVAPPQALSRSATLAADVLAVDLDLDGDLDVVSADRYGKLATYQNQGKGNTQGQLVFSEEPHSPSSLATGDLNADGYPDLVVGRDSSINGISLYWNQAGVLGQPIVIASTEEFMTEVELADLDGDQRLDLLVCSDSGSQAGVSWYRGLGQGSFGPRRELILGTYTQSVAVDDLDADGDLDVLAGGSGFGALDPLTWVENLGGGSFSAPITIDSGLSFRDVECVDLDGDGDRDVVAAGAGVYTFLNLGGGNFAAPQPLSQDFTFELEAADIDGDGRTDLCVAFESSIDLYLGLAQGGFGPAQVLSERTASGQGISLEDMDQDGDLDLLHANWSMGEFWWAENRSDTAQGTAFCAPNAINSTGRAATLSGAGSPLAKDGSLALIAGDLPAGQIGMFLVAPSQGFVPNPGGSQGDLCLSGGIGRFRGPGQVQASDQLGQLALTLDLGTLPTPSGSTAALAGDTWFFQLWYRDQNPLPTSNFSSGLAMTFQ